MVGDYPLGVGPGNFTQKIGDYDSSHRWRASHNSVVACFTELGIQGGILFLLIMGGSARLLHRSVKLAKHSDYPMETSILAYAFFASFVTYIVTALGTQRLYCESFWWVMALPLCLYRATAREVHSTAEEPRLAQSHAAHAEPVPLDGYGSRPYAW
jgi:O-antigen ligase